MSSEWMRGNCPRRRSGGGNRNMVVVTLAMILTFFPASAFARIIPDTASPNFEKAISDEERTPQVFANHGNFQDLQTPQEANTSILDKNHGDHGSRSSRRELVGSSPPTCVARCGTCQPCKPVHVAITSPHSTISEADYYPEVWRCECGNNYYMP